MGRFLWVFEYDVVTFCRCIVTIISHDQLEVSDFEIDKIVGECLDVNREEV